MIITCPECKTDYRVASAALGSDGRKVKCRHCSHIWLARANEGAGEDHVEDQEPAEQPSAANEQAGVPEGEAVAQDREGDALAEVKIDRGRDPEEAALREMLSGAGLAAKIGMDSDKRTQRRLSLRRSKGESGARRGSIRNPAIGVAAAAAVIALLLAGALAGRESLVRHLPGTARIFAALGYPVNLRGLEFRNVTFRTEIDNGVPVLAVSGDIVNVTDKAVAVPDIRFSLRNASRHEVYHWTGRAESGEVAPDGGTAFLTRLASPPLAADHLQIHFVDPLHRRASGRS
jgi:predicted Zn finger-like uncharacterized protein